MFDLSPITEGKIAKDDADEKKDGDNNSDENANRTINSKLSKSWAMDSVSTATQASTTLSLHGNLLLTSNLSVLLKYKVVSEIGEGSMGTVSKVRLRNRRVAPSPSGNSSSSSFQGLKIFRTATLKQVVKPHFYALKQIKLTDQATVFMEEIKNEISILRTLDHPNIVRIFEIYNYDRNLDVICELCDGGDLYARFPYSQYDTGKYISQLISAVKYMHDHHIVHRDLKFENIMFEDKTKDAEIKVIDFGLSKILQKKKLERTTECVGTIDTMAPEVMRGIHSSKADMWSIGVITFMMLSSKQPFFHYSRKKMEEAIKTASYSFDTPGWAKITDDAKDFVSKLLVVKTKDRMSADDAIKHPFIVRARCPAVSLLGTTKSDEEVAFENALVKIHDALRRYKDTSDLKKLALNIVAHRSASSKVAVQRRAFERYDMSTCDGVIDFAEFRTTFCETGGGGSNMFQKTKEKQEDDNVDFVRQIFDSLDVNNNGHIQYTEFLAATAEAFGPINEDRIIEAFDRLDYDGKGYITDEDLHQVLNVHYTMDRIAHIINECDVDENGIICWSEFKALFRDTDTANGKVEKRKDGNTSVKAQRDRRQQPEQSRSSSGNGLKEVKFSPRYMTKRSSFI